MLALLKRLDFLGLIALLVAAWGGYGTLRSVEKAIRADGWTRETSLDG